MSNPLEGTYRLCVWEVGGSSEEPTDTGRTGSLEEMSALGLDAATGKAEVTLPDGRKLVPGEMAGYVCRPEGAK